MLKRGLFGCELKQQVTVIALTYCILSILLMTYGFFAYLHPEKLIRYPGDRNKTKEVHQSLSSDQDPTEINNTWQDGISTSEIGNDLQNKTILPFPILTSNDTMDLFMNDSEPTTMKLVALDTNTEETSKNSSKKEFKAFENLKNFMSNEGLEIIVGSLLKLLCSILLFQGSRLNKHVFFIPWLVEESIEMFGGVIFFVIDTIKTKHGGSYYLFSLIFFILGGYFLYSVGSYFNILRRKNINSTIIVQSVSQGVAGIGVSGGYQNGLNYQRLEEDCWQSEPNLSSEFKPSFDNGFRREKKVAEDDNDEHVLYVQ